MSAIHKLTLLRRKRRLPLSLPVRYSSGQGKKRKEDLNRSRLPLFRQGGATVGLTTRLSTERLHIYREVCGSDKGKVNQAGYFGYSLVEMAFVVGQGVIDATGLEHQGGT